MVEGTALIQTVRSRIGLITSLPVINNTDSSVEYVYSAQNTLTLPARNPGDVTQIAAKCEITDSLPYAVMLGMYIAMSDGTELSQPRAMDLNPSMRGHQRLEEDALIDDGLLNSLGIPLTQPDGWQVSFILYAASTAAKPGAKLSVADPGYSEMWAVHTSA